MTDWVEPLARAIATRERRQIPAFPGRRNDRGAGVLVGLRGAADPRVTLVERAAHLRDHAGEVGFPGGKPELGDADLVATAVRETREELGVIPVSILGPLSSMPLFTSDYRLHPVVALLPEAPLRPDPGEVARALSMPVLPWLDQGIPGIPWTWRGEQVRSPVFPLSRDGTPTVGAARPDAVVYGGTAHVLLELLEVLGPVLGRPRPRVVGGWRWTDEGPVSTEQTG